GRPARQAPGVGALARTGHRLRAALDLQPRLRRTAVSSEPSTTTGALARLGFSSTDRVRRFLAEPALEGLGAGAAKALGATADGDDAVLGLLRLSEAALEAGQTALCEEFLAGVGREGTGGQ